MSRPKYFIKTEVMVYGGRTKYYVVKGFSDEDQIAKVGSERDATKLCEEFERLTDDNSRLKAENERLDALCKQLMAQHSDISCENIMLRKAGDAMAEALNLNDDVFDNRDKREAQAAWLAAKEGKGQP